MTLARRLLRPLSEMPAYGWAAALLVLLLLLLAWSTRAGAPPGAVAIQQAQVRMLNMPVIDDRTVSLPHTWDNARRHWSGRALYTLALPTTIGTDVWVADGLAVLLPRVSVRFRLLLNGHELLSESWREGAGYVDTGNQAHFVILPSALLATEPAANWLQIEIQGEALRTSGLERVWVGPRDALQHRHQELQIWQVNLTWMVAACAFMLGLMALLIWRYTAEALFGLLAGGLLTLALRLLLSTPLLIPGPFWVWDYLHKLSFTWYYGFTYLFMAQLFLFGQRQVRRVVTGMMALAPLWLLLVVAVGDYRLYRWWMGLVVAICVYALVKVLGRVRWGIDTSQRLMVVVAVATLITGVRDFLVVKMGLPGDVDIRWMTPGSMVLMFAMAWVMMRRTTEAFSETRRLSAELAQTQRVLEGERRRLTRDMHDGLGSQLVHTLNMVQRRDRSLNPAVVAVMISHALDELRLTLDSLEPMDGDLLAALGTLRQRIEPALEAAGIDLDWQVQPVPPVAGLEAQGVMHLFRCLQEVFANVVKHAYASRVTVRTWVQDGRVGLSVSDNGVGLSQSIGARAVDLAGGRGLGNIRLRAHEMGAEVRFEDARPGTCVSFLLQTEQPARGDPPGAQPQAPVNIR